MTFTPPLCGALLIALLSILPGPAIAQSAAPGAPAPSIVIQWNQAALQGVRDSKFGPPQIARALAVIHTCIYDAWAAYDNRASGTRLGALLRRPAAEHKASNIDKAISYAASRCASDVFPMDRESVFVPLMKRLGYDPNDNSLDPATPQGVGNIAATAVLLYRHRDGSNQLGDMTSSGVPYADYTGYQPVNPPSAVPVDPATVVDLNRWQPLQYADATGALIVQKFAAPYWTYVKSFAMSSGCQFRAFAAQYGPAKAGTPEFVGQAQELIDISAALTDAQKMMAEYWADGPHSETPPGHWNLFAQYVSARDRNSLDDDVKLFFALTNAVADAAIAAWDDKAAFDSVRPVTAIPYLFQGSQIRSWGGPGRGTVTMDGRNWVPYQPATQPTPPFPEFISGHSTFSAAGAEILRLFTRKDDFGASVSFPPGSSTFEPGFTPAGTVTLTWPTFTAAADEAGMSRRYGGIHYRAADLTGRAVGRLVAQQAWEKAVSLWSGSDKR